MSKKSSKKNEKAEAYIKGEMIFCTPSQNQISKIENGKQFAKNCIFYLVHTMGTKKAKKMVEKMFSDFDEDYEGSYREKK